MAPETDGLPAKQRVQFCKFTSCLVNGVRCDGFLASPSLKKKTTTNISQRFSYGFHTQLVGSQCFLVKLPDVSRWGDDLPTFPKEGPGAVPRPGRPGALGRAFGALGPGPAGPGGSAARCLELRGVEGLVVPTTSSKKGGALAFGFWLILEVNRYGRSRVTLKVDVSHSCDAKALFWRVVWCVVPLGSVIQRIGTTRVPPASKEELLARSRTDLLQQIVPWLQ